MSNQEPSRSYDSNILIIALILIVLGVLLLAMAFLASPPSAPAQAPPAGGVHGSFSFAVHAYANNTTKGGNETTNNTANSTASGVCDFATAQTPGSPCWYLLRQGTLITQQGSTIFFLETVAGASIIISLLEGFLLGGYFRKTKDELKNERPATKYKRLQDYTDHLLKRSMADHRIAQDACKALGLDYPKLRDQRMKETNFLKDFIAFNADMTEAKET